MAEQRIAGILRKNALTFATILGVVMGILLGVALKSRVAPYSKREAMYVGFPGELFLRALKGVIIPLIVSSIICAIGGMDMRLSGRIGGLAICYYLSTSFLAIILGVILVLSIRPGDVGEGEDDDIKDEKTKERLIMMEDVLMDLFRNIIPPNVVEATMFVTTTQIEKKEMVRKEDWPLKQKKRQSTNFLGLIAFSVIFGIALARAADEIKRPVLDFMYSVSKIMITITLWLVYLAPIGILFLVAGKIIAEDDYATLFKRLGLYVATVLTGLIIHGAIFLPLIYWIFVRELPFTYIANLGKAIATAWGTSSSSATMPVTLVCLEENNKMDKRVTRFIVPIGATINMDGTALYEAVAPIFIAQTLDMDLSFGNVVAIAITATAASIGAAGIPSAGLVTMVIVLDTVNIPSEHIGIILAVDWFLDRFRTSVNVLGDCIGAAVVQKLSKKDLDAAPSYDELEAKRTNVPEYSHLETDIPESKEPPAKPPGKGLPESKDPSAKTEKKPAPESSATAKKLYARNLGSSADEQVKEAKKKKKKKKKAAK